MSAFRDSVTRAFSEWDWKPTTAVQKLTVAQLEALAAKGSPTPISGDATSTGRGWA
jgi:hypothetical protein